MINLITQDWEIQDIDTIFFDKDGTFIDLHYFWGKMTELRVQEIINRFNIDSGMFSQLCMYLGFNNKTGIMLKDGITALYSRPKIIEIFKNDLKTCGVNTSNKELEEIFDSVSKNFYENMHNYTKPIENAINFIKTVKKLGIKTGIITSDSLESTNLTLQHFGWEALFDTVIGRESTAESKESGIGVKMALEILKSSPQNSVMIGDAPMDYLAAKNAGIEKTILVSTGQIEKSELLKTSSYVVDDLKEIKTGSGCIPLPE